MSSQDDLTADTEQGTEKKVVVKNSLNNKQKFRLIAITVLVILLVIFIYQNYNRVEIEFLNYVFRVRIVVIILVSSLVGSLITLLLMKLRSSKKK